MRFLGRKGIGTYNSRRHFRPSGAIFSLLRVIVKVVGRSILEWLTAISTATEVIYSNFGELDFTSNHV